MLQPNADSGVHPIVHTGHEFVFCLQGRIAYTIEEHTHLLEAGDSLLFEARLPQRWQNVDPMSSHGHPGTLSLRQARSSHRTALHGLGSRKPIVRSAQGDEPAGCFIIPRLKGDTKWGALG